MEERDRAAVYEEPVSLALDRTRRQVPVRDIVGIVSQGCGAEQVRRQVDPSLVCEKPAGELDKTPIAHALLPPTQEFARHCRPADCDKAEVERSGDQDVLFVRSLSVEGKRL